MYQIETRLPVSTKIDFLAFTRSAFFVRRNGHRACKYLINKGIFNMNQFRTEMRGRVVQEIYKKLSTYICYVRLNMELRTLTVIHKKVNHINNRTIVCALGKAIDIVAKSSELFKKKKTTQLHVNHQSQHSTMDSGSNENP